MKTDELIKMLGTNLEPVKAGELRNTMLVALAIAVGAVASICLVWARMRMSANVNEEAHWGFMVIALAFTLGLAIAGAATLLKSARPGHSLRGPLLLVGLPLLTVVCAGIGALTTQDRTLWGAMLDGGPWGTCLICIPIFAAIPFGALIWALRKGAPTHLRLTGSVAGVVAGALGAAAVVIHQTAQSIPSIGLWYGIPIALCAVVGALLGPRLLRW